MITRILLATLAGGVVMFLLGFLIYGILLDAFMKANMMPEAAKLMKDPPNLSLLFLSFQSPRTSFGFVTLVIILEKISITQSSSLMTKGHYTILLKCYNIPTFLNIPSFDLHLIPGR